MPETDPRKKTTGGRMYPVKSVVPPAPPNYERVVAVLNDEDLAFELELGLGMPEYQEAVRAEVARRGKEN